MAVKPKGTKKARRKGPTMIQRSRAVSAAAKAYYHQVSGAGKSRVLRKFFGLSPRELDAITRLAGVRVKFNLDNRITKA